MMTARSLIALLVLLGCVPTASSDESSPAKLALLIGIDEYKSPSVPDLRGAVNDVELMRSILIGKFNFPADNVKLLTNADATHQGIVSAIQSHLIARAQPGDVVVLHYSGHGSRMRDDSGDEIDRYDETLVPHDSRTEDVYDLTDDQINGLLAQLTARTRNVTLILDSCHSGAASRGGSTVRRIDVDQRPPPPVPGYAVSARGTGEGSADFRLNGSDYVLISGSLATELSSEGVFDERRHGVMTWYLARALQSAGDTSTYRSVMDEVKAAVTVRYPSQHPQLEGPGVDLRVFGSDRINPLPYVLVKPDGSSHVELQGGGVYGLSRDSLLRVYPPDTVDFSEAQPVATIRVTAVESFSARAVVEEGGPVPEGSKAVLEAVMYGGNAVPLHVPVSEHPSLEAIAEALESYPTLDLVDSEEDAKLIVDLDADAIAVRSADLEMLVPPVPVSDRSHVERIVEQVQDLVHWLMVLDVENPSGAIDIDFDMRRGDDPPGAAAPTEVSPATRLTYRVTNRGHEALYVYVLDISSDGSIALLYPRASGSQEELAPNDFLERTIETFLPNGREAVIDVLKVIATTRPIDPSVFPQGALRSAPPVTRGTQDPLAAFLAQSVRGNTRGARPVDIKEWVTAQKVFTIRRLGVRFFGFTLNFSEPREATDLSAGFDTSRSACSGVEGEGAECFERLRASSDGTAWDLVQRKVTRDAAESVRSVGRAFDEAYQIQDQLPGAVRVEPLLEVQVPGVVNERGIDKRGLGSDSIHDDAARIDDAWHLKQIRAPEAWQKIREATGAAEGTEAAGILVAHIDTGYRDHPETWLETGGKRPIDPGKGHDYYDDDDDPVDPLLDNLPLDNPGHGTAAGSVIVSPSGCQLADAPGCVNGLARGAQLVPLRVHRTVSQFNTSNISRAIRDVAEGNIDGAPRLISIAMGGPPTFSMWRAVKAAERSGVVVVAAAGNYVRTVVWPARFSATIAVAANNVRCQPWQHSSRGSRVDISAPGESVWRATLNEQHEYINAMGKGTTFATGNTSGSIALWLARHGSDSIMQQLRESGRVTETLRRALASSAWQPAADTDRDPPDTHCTDAPWDESRYGPGILDVSALLDVPLQTPGALSMPAREIEEIPLYSSLYPVGTDPDRIRADYRALFQPSQGATTEDLYPLETEILFHYTMDEDVQRSIDAVVSGQRAVEPFDRVRGALLENDVSERLRQTLSP